MKKNILTLAFLVIAVLGSQFANAQGIKTPAPSPSCKIEQALGLTNINIEYSRPSMKDRTIFASDGLVPFGNLWRTGANASTKIEFGEDVKINGKDLAAGKYALYTIPNASEWEIIFYKDLSHWGTPKDMIKEEVALRVFSKVKSLPMVFETFTIHVNNIKANSADVMIMWDKTMASFSVEVEVEKKVLASIEKAMAGTSRGDYYTSARYYYDNDMDMNKALTWAKKANQIEGKFWQYRLQSEIEAKLNKYGDAIGSAQKSLEMAKEAGNMDYVRMNEKNIAKWKGKAKGGMGASKKM